MKEAEKLGFEVDYVCDAPSNSNVSKAFGRINKKFIYKSTKNYFNKTVVPLIKNNDYDVVLLVAGMTFSFTKSMVKEIKSNQKKAYFVMYQWDSEKNLPYVMDIHQYFDDLYTFDRYDSLKNECYKFLPLFYNSVYEQVGKNYSDNFVYDCMYIGTAHPQKFYDINRMGAVLKEKMPNQFIYHYMPSKLKFCYQKATSKLFRKAKLSDCKFDKISSSDMMIYFAKSKCILDAPQAGQTGLTIRSIECLGAKKKLITTNEDIKNYDFYNEKNILIFSGNIDFNSSFFIEKYEDIPGEIYEKYSLHNWLISLIGGEI